MLTCGFVSYPYISCVWDLIHNNNDVDDDDDDDDDDMKKTFLIEKVYFFLYAHDTRKWEEFLEKFLNHLLTKDFFLFCNNHRGTKD